MFEIQLGHPPASIFRCQESSCQRKTNHLTWNLIDLNYKIISSWQRFITRDHQVEKNYRMSKPWLKQALWQLLFVPRLGKSIFSVNSSMENTHPSELTEFENMLLHKIYFHTPICAFALHETSPQNVSLEKAAFHVDWDFAGHRLFHSQSQNSPPHVPATQIHSMTTGLTLLPRREKRE